MKVLVLNCGSSSVKYQVIETSAEAIEANADVTLARGSVEYPNGRVVNYTRDTQGRETKVSSTHQGQPFDYIYGAVYGGPQGSRPDADSVPNGLWAQQGDDGLHVFAAKPASERYEVGGEHAEFQLYE